VEEGAQGAKSEVDGGGAEPALAVAVEAGDQGGPVGGQHRRGEVGQPLHAHGCHRLPDGALIGFLRPG
jgi:hypothetical protein